MPRGGLAEAGETPIVPGTYQRSAPPARGGEGGADSSGTAVQRVFSKRTAAVLLPASVRSKPKVSRKVAESRIRYFVLPTVVQADMSG
jgi:hypothetical protein